MTNSKESQEEYDNVSADFILSPSVERDAPAAEQPILSANWAGSISELNFQCADTATLFFNALDELKFSSDELDEMTVVDQAFQDEEKAERRERIGSLVRARQSSPETIARKRRDQRSGRIAQAMDAIDAFRKSPEGREQHNRLKREKYAAVIAAEHGREVREHVKQPSAERRSQQLRDASNRSYAKKTATMSAAELAIFKAERAAKERARRAARKDKIKE